MQFKISRCVLVCHCIICIRKTSLNKLLLILITMEHDTLVFFSSNQRCMIFKFDFIKILAPFLKRVGVWLKFEIKKLNDLLQCMPKWRNMEIIIGGSELKSYLTIKRLHIAQLIV